jgi:hypothetical protein
MVDAASVTGLWKFPTAASCTQSIIPLLVAQALLLEETRSPSQAFFLWHVAFLSSLSRIGMVKSARSQHRSVSLLVRHL